MSNFEKLMAMVEGLTDDEKSKVREALGIKVEVRGPSTPRMTGKAQRTEKPLTEKVAKQMEILINTLPADRAVDLVEWADLAVAGGLVTQQPAVRIVAYYKKPIVDGGYATLIG